MQAAFVAAGLLLVYWRALAAYLGDQHYQEHFVYLWVFLGIALWRSLKGPFRGRFGLSTGRDCVGVALALFAAPVLAVSTLAGSSMGMRLSLVLFITGCAVVVVSKWSVKRCLMHGLLMQLCFGIPYSVYFPLTSKLQWGVATMLSVPAELGLASYTVEAGVVRFPHYDLVITADCAGLGQLLTFVGIAALGVLCSARRRSRTLMAFGIAVGLAWLSNLARVGLFVLLVGMGWTRSVDDDFWHAGLGFLVFLPFVVALVAWILKTHVPPPNQVEVPSATGRIPVAWLMVPLLVAQWGLRGGNTQEFPEPAYFASLSTPPGHQLVVHGPSEESDRAVYETPWLINARFQDANDRYFDLMHYATRSFGHLCVHQVSRCVQVLGQRVTYEPPVLIDGRPWWRISFDREDPQDSVHVYFFFEIGGVRFDDSIRTQWEVCWQRLLGRSSEVRCSRVMFPGSLPKSPGEHEAAVLTWLGRLFAGG